MSFIQSGKIISIQSICGNNAWTGGSALQYWFAARLRFHKNRSLLSYSNRVHFEIAGNTANRILLLFLNLLIHGPGVSCDQNISRGVLRDWLTILLSEVAGTRVFASGHPTHQSVRAQWLALAAPDLSVSQHNLDQRKSMVAGAGSRAAQPRERNKKWRKSSWPCTHSEI